MWHVTITEDKLSITTNKLAIVTYLYKDTLWDNKSQLWETKRNIVTVVRYKDALGEIKTLWDKTQLWEIKWQL